MQSCCNRKWKNNTQLGYFPLKVFGNNATKCSLQFAFAYIPLHYEKDNVDQAIMVIRFVLILKAF